MMQASAESSICVIVEEGEAQAATVVLEMAFERELQVMIPPPLTHHPSISPRPFLCDLCSSQWCSPHHPPHPLLSAVQRGLVADINTEYGHSIVAIVGEGMAFRRGTGATFTKAMTTAGVNIRAIAQGSSERQISLVVEAEDCSKALRAAHAALALSSTQISIAVLGATGDVGTEFLQQLVESQMAIADASEAGGKRQIVSELNVAFKVTAPPPPPSSPPSCSAVTLPPPLPSIPLHPPTSSLVATRR